MDLRKSADVTAQFDTLLADLDKSAQGARFVCDELLDVIAAQNATFMSPALQRIQVQLDNQMAEISMYLKEVDQQYFVWLAAVKAEDEARYEEWLKKMNFITHEAEEFAIREMLDKEAQSQRNLQSMLNTMANDIVKRAELCVTRLMEFKTILEQRSQKVDAYLIKIDAAVKNEHKKFKIKSTQLAVQIKANEHQTFHPGIYNTEYLHDKLILLGDKYEKGLMTLEEYTAELRIEHRNAMHHHVRHSMTEIELNKRLNDDFGELHRHHLVDHQAIMARLAAAKADIIHIKAKTDAAYINVDREIQQNREIGKNTRSSDSRESLVQRDASLSATDKFLEEDRENVKGYTQTFGDVDDLLKELAEKEAKVINLVGNIDHAVLSKLEEKEPTTEIKHQADSPQDTDEQTEGQPEPQLDISDEQPGAPTPLDAESPATSEPTESITDDLLAELEASSEPQPDISDEQPGAATTPEATEGITDETLAELEPISEPHLDLSDEQPGAPTSSDVKGVEAPETTEGITEETLAELEGIPESPSAEEKSSIQTESTSESSIDDSTLEDLLKEMDASQPTPQTDIPPTHITNKTDKTERQELQSDDKRHGEPDPNRSLRWGKEQIGFNTSKTIPDKKTEPNIDSAQKSAKDKHDEMDDAQRHRPRR